jgi:hypothetical protein
VECNARFDFSKLKKYIEICSSKEYWVKAKKYHGQPLKLVGCHAKAFGHLEHDQNN